MIPCDEIISVMGIVSPKKTNTIATNIEKSCHSKKVRYRIDCLVLRTVLLVIILLLFAIIMQSIDQNKKTLMRKQCKNGK